jgi:hypothetical protein
MKPARKRRNPDDQSPDLDWLRGLGLGREEVTRLSPAIPGGMTSATSFYVNSAIRGTVFRGQEQTSLPPTSGRWFLIPLEIVDAHPELKDQAVRPAMAVRLAPMDGPSDITAWTAGG